MPTAPREQIPNEMMHVLSQVMSGIQNLSARLETTEQATAEATRSSQALLGRMNTLESRACLTENVVGQAVTQLQATSSAPTGSSGPSDQNMPEAWLLTPTRAGEMSLGPDLNSDCESVSPIKALQSKDQ